MPHTPMIIARRQTARMRRSAFTLVELMVSIALALLLLVGINKVFKTTTDTVGTGYATSQAMRQQMAVDRAFDHTFFSAVAPSQQPFILIHSQQQYAYMDRNDMNGDRDGDWRTVDLDGNGTEGEATVYGEFVNPANYGTRSHRLDCISFFVRDTNNPFHRVTGDHNSNSGLVSNEYSPEAYVWLGHLRLPTNTSGTNSNPNPAHSNLTPMNPADGTATSNGQYFDPAQATLFDNPNNYFASDWALGQETILLKGDPTVDFLSGAGSLAPLSNSSTANFTDPQTPNKGSASAWTIPQSRIDVAKTTISDYRTQILEKLGTGTLPVAAVASLDYRFNAKPWVDKPATSTMSQTAYMQVVSREMALTTPYLFRGCTQFIVEFAGDFITQNPDGTINTTAPNGGRQPDGVVDFVVATPSPTLPSSTGYIRRTRWYGFPRDVAGPVSASNPTGGPDGKIDSTYDVVPVRDVAGAAMPFESNVNTTLPQASDYMTSLAPGATYICAWGPDQLDPTKPTVYMPPQMIRIVMQLTDPQGRLGEGPVSEYVYKFGH